MPLHRGPQHPSYATDKKLSKLPLRNRASAMHCCLVTFYRRNDLHRRLTPTFNESAHLLCIQRINFSYAKMHPTLHSIARGLTRLMPPFQTTPANTCINFILPKLESLSKISPLTTCVYLCSFSRNYFRTSYGRKPDKPALQNLTRNSHSRSFKVMHYRITEKPTTDCVSLYNKAGLISKVSEEIAIEIAENCRCRQTRCRLTPPHRESPRISALPESRVVLHFCR